MDKSQNRRALYRRFSDRRVVALLELHEILFYDEPGISRDIRLLDTINNDYQVHRSAVVQLVDSAAGAVNIVATCQNWDSDVIGTQLEGDGISRIIKTHEEFGGALTLSKFRKSSLFEDNEWQSLWEKEMSSPASALLSVPIFPKSTNPAYLWIIIDSGSREWSSHDRDLSEEEAIFLAKAIDKKMIGADFITSL